MANLLQLTQKKVRRIRDVRSCTQIEILRRFLTLRDEKKKKSIFETASIIVSEIEINSNKNNVFPKQRYYLRNKIIKLYQDFRRAKINFKPNTSLQTRQVGNYYDQLFQKFSCTQDNERAIQNRSKNICSDNDIKVEEIQADDEFKDPNWIQAKKKVSKFFFISPNICRLLDRLGISSNSMAKLFFELKRENNVSGFTSSTYILKRRNQERQECLKRLQEFEFPNFLILHWDGKKMENNNREMVERLIISISAPNGIQKLISCNFLESGSAKSLAVELKTQCDKLNITKKIVGLSYDTTAVNSGVKGGAALLFEKSIATDGDQKSLNRRPCRLHQKELCVSNPYKEVVMKTVGAGIPIFAQFRKWFIHNKHLKITPAYFLKTAKPIFDQNLQYLIDFYGKQVKINHRRADHLEAAELALVHLNANPNYKLKLCGPDHHARWLSKVIYILKIMLFKEHFDISETLLEQFQAMLIYFIKVYLIHWFTCESTIYAAKNDLDFLTEVDEFSKIKGAYFPLIARSAKCTQLRHMDYVSEENSIFSLFDNRIPVQEKENLRIKLLGRDRKVQFKNLSVIDPCVSFTSNVLEDDENICSFPIADKETTIDLIEVINAADQIILEQNFNEVDVDEEITMNENEPEKIVYQNVYSGKSPLDFISLKSLKTLKSYGINLSFMLFNAADWASHKSYSNALQKAKNIQSTSIYTEQLVGKISRLNNSGLVKDKENLDCLALSAVERSE